MKMRKDLILGLSVVGLLVVVIIVYLIARHELKNKGESYHAGRALIPSSPGEYDDIGGVPRFRLGIIFLFFL